MHLRRILSVGLIAFLAALTACDNSTGPPETARITGTLWTAGTATRPDTGTVQVSLFVSWDSTQGLATDAAGGPPAIASELIPQGDNSFVIENITFGEYQAVAVSWRDTTLSGQSATTTIGAWGANPQAGDNTPATIVLSESNADVEMDIPVDYSRAKVATGPTGSISGTITLDGTWPSSSVYLVVMTSVGPAPTFPPTSQPAAMAPLAQFSGTSDYVIPNVPQGTYAFVGAYTYPTFSFLGGYGVDLSGGDQTAESVTVGPPSDVDATGIDFTISQ